VKVLFTTQSTSLRVFEALRAALAEQAGVERAGFTIADRMFYAEWLREHPAFETAGHALVKEWDVTARRHGTPDLQLLARYEREVGGEAGLFGAIVADRRLFMGPDCTYTQDYRRRFTDNELLCILQEGLIATERLFDELKPDVLMGFICVTLLDYLAYLFARARGVRVLNLRPTRVGDRVMFGSILNDPAPEFMQVYQRILASGSPRMGDARAYLRRVREQHGRYEGVVQPSAKPALAVNPDRQPGWKAALGVARNYARYHRSGAATDNHVPNPIRALLFAAMVNPLRARAVGRMLRDRYITRTRLREQRYAFYPMHTEPEVSLLVYGRPFINQIEVIRQLALSLPVDMRLVVKEHPWMVGKRTRSAYAKLLNIPRVHIASPDMDARDLIAGAALVGVITGSNALEAAMLGRPVITFGDCPYNALPAAMVRRCDDLRELPSLIRTMIEGHENDEAALEAYVSAVFELSESVNLYSVLLEKRGVHSDRPAAYAGEIDKLARYALACARVPADAPAEASAALW
jgi:hypothetical protein